MNLSKPIFKGTRHTVLLDTMPIHLHDPKHAHTNTDWLCRLKPLVVD